MAERTTTTAPAQPARYPLPDPPRHPLDAQSGHRGIPGPAREKPQPSRTPRR